MQVLIVDDSKILQERILGLIEVCEKVTKIEQAFNTNDAKAKLSGGKFDVVISDIRMPGGGGFELLEYIKNHHKKLSTIIITNYPYPQYKEKAKQLGSDYFLSKSDELDQLVNVLDEIAGSLSKV